MRERLLVGKLSVALGVLSVRVAALSLVAFRLGGLSAYMLLLLGTTWLLANSPALAR